MTDNHLPTPTGQQCNENAIETPLLAPIAVHKRTPFTHVRNRNQKSSSTSVPTVKIIPMNEPPTWPSKSPTRYTTPQKTLNGPSNFVEYSYQLEELCKNLLIEKTLGIAFKTFADHSYQFVCILQISTEDKDYIVDAISLRNQLFLLNDILSNPQICKIVYERNLVLSLMYNLLGLDLVNVYDINQMALRYNISSNNTFDLGQKLCNSTAELSRSLEGADWRFRPLPNEMRNYAHQETALLIPIYRELQNLEKLHGGPPMNPSTEAAPNIADLFSSASWRISNRALCMQGGNTNNLHEPVGFSEDLKSIGNVPDSMEEIYILSNANRKRNKEKKKMKGDNAKLDSQFAIEEEEEEEETTAESETQQKQLPNPEEFMRKIGWLSEDKEGHKTLSLTPEPRTAHRRTKSGDGSERTKHKRRGKRHRKQSSCTFPPKGGFPFNDPNQSTSASPFARRSPKKPPRN